MQSLFYFGNLLYSHLQLPPSALYACSSDPGYLVFPVLTASPSFLELQAEKSCLLTTCGPESEELTEKSASVRISEKNTQSVKSRSFRKQPQEKSEQSEEFRVKEGRGGATGIYKKKNTESNIVNQTFAYLSSDRSRRAVTAFFKEDWMKVDEYYRLMCRVKQVNKKYINRKYLKRLLEFSAHSEFQKAFTKARVTSFTINCMEKLLRVLIFHFLRENSVLTLLTSSKIYKQTLPQHFWRKREIMEFLFKEGRIRNSNTAA